MRKLLIILSLLVGCGIEAATITNWGRQLSGVVPKGDDAILIQQGGITYFFTPNQLATNLATNSVFMSLSGASNKVSDLNGKATNATLYGAISNNNYRALLVPLQTTFATNFTDVVSAQLGFTFDTSKNYNYYAGNGGTRTTNIVGVLDPVDPLAFEINGSYNGVWNTFVGVDAGSNNYSGNMNTFVGAAAGQRNQNGVQNTFVGSLAGVSNTNGYHNTFIGTSAGQNNSSGYFNTKIGTDNGLLSATGHDNTSVGASAATYDDGAYNAWYGAGSGAANTVGYGNTASGYNSMSGNLTGTYNSAHGYQANALNTTGSNITAQGYNSLLYATGPYNTGVGATVGYNPYNNISQYRITSDDYITLLGYGATKDNAVKITNAMALGAGTMVLTNNQTVIGNSNVTSTIVNGRLGRGTYYPGVVNGTTFSTVGLHISGAQSYAVFDSISGGSGGILINDASQSADSRLWSININDTSGGLGFGTLTDAGATTQRATFDRSGNLGIGTATPTVVNGTTFSTVGLQVSGPAKYVVFDSTAGGAGGLLLNDASESADSRIWSININNGTALSLGTMSDGGSTVQRVTLTRSGALGIGTLAPATGASLDVTGGVYSASQTITNTLSILAKSFTAPAPNTGFGAHLWTDGTNLCVVIENAAGARTTNKLSMAAWP